MVKNKRTLFHPHARPRECFVLQIPRLTFGTTQLRPMVLLTLTSIVLLLTFACLPQQRVFLSPQEQHIAKVLKQADSAWTNHNYSLAEELYASLLEAQAAKPQQKILIRKRLAAAAVRNDHFELAEKALRSWKSIQATAERSWPWQSLFLKTLHGLGQTDQLIKHAQGLLARNDLTFHLKLDAVLLLGPFLLEKNQFQELTKLLQALSLQADNQKKRRLAIQKLSRFLQETSLPVLSSLIETCTAEQARDFPCLLYRWQEVKTLYARQELGRLQVQQQLKTLLATSDPVLGSVLRQDLKSLGLADIAEGPGLHIGLLIPLSGPYRHIGWDISTGVDIAQWQLLQSGIQFEVTVINSAGAAWQQELEALPADCFLVGGPLRESIWKEIHTGGLHRQKTFFTFRSRLNPGIEGVDAYRFFPARADQVRPLIRFLSLEMGIERYGILYPKSAFGRKMARTFAQTVQDFNGKINALSGYSPKAQTDFRSLLSDFLRVPKQPQAKTSGPENTSKDCSYRIRPTPDFQAVFLPDSFSIARRIIPEFFFFDEYRLIFLGPTLWSQQLKKVSDLDPSYYQMALIPGGWWSENPSPAVQGLKQGLEDSAQGDPNFWIALGYDLTRFFHHVSTTLIQEKKNLNTALNLLSDFSWSMAPLAWNAQGKATQNMFIFQLQDKHLQPVSLSRLKRLVSVMQQEYEYVLRNRLEENGCRPEEIRIDSFGDLNED